LICFSAANTLEKTIGEETCNTANQGTYCNGPLTESLQIWFVNSIHDDWYIKALGNSFHIM